MLEAGFLTIGIITGIFDMLSPLITTFLTGPAKDRARRLLESKRRYAIKILNSNDDLERKASEINKTIDDLTSTLSNTSITKDDFKNKIRDKINQYKDKNEIINKARNDLNTRLNQINEYNVNDNPRDLFELASSDLNDEKVINKLNNETKDLNKSIFKWKEEYNAKF